MRPPPPVLVTSWYSFSSSSSSIGTPGSAAARASHGHSHGAEDRLAGFTMTLTVSWAWVMRQTRRIRGPRRALARHTEWSVAELIWVGPTRRDTMDGGLMGRIMGVLVAAVVGLAGVAIAAPAAACDCEVISVDEAFSQATAVFVGTIR